MKCICCEKEHFQKYSENSYLSLPIYMCNNCGLYVTGVNEFELKKQVTELYRGKYWDERKAVYMIKNSYQDVHSREQRVRWLSQIDYCKPFISNKKIFEIGIGAGQSMYWFQESGYEVTGLEPDERNIKLLKKNLKKQNEIICGYAEDLQIENKFDFVWASHVIEHTIRPDIVFKKIFYALKNNGYFFIEVPNCMEKNTLEGSIYDNPSTFHFSKKHLLELGERSGFKLIKSDIFQPIYSIKTKLKWKFHKKLNFSNSSLIRDKFILAKETEGINLRALFQKSKNFQV